MPDLLLEVGVEEVPATYLRSALDQLREDTRTRLQQQPHNVRMTLYVHCEP